MIIFSAFSWEENYLQPVLASLFNPYFLTPLVLAVISTFQVNLSVERSFQTQVSMLNISSVSARQTFVAFV